MKIYIAGPMAGIKNRNTEAFQEAGKKYTSMGYIVLNPDDLPNADQIKPAEYMDIDLAMIRACDEIYMLKGWEKSKGAFLEHAYAVYLELKITYQERHSRLKNIIKILL